MMTTTTTSTITSTIIRERDEGEATWFFNALVTTKASTAETGGAYSLTEHLVTAASNPPMHVQVDEDEAFYVLEGEIEFEVDGDEAHVIRPQAAANAGWLDGEAVMMESLLAFKRAGAAGILTYFAPRAAAVLNEMRA